MGMRLGRHSGRGRSAAAVVGAVVSATALMVVGLPGSAAAEPKTWCADGSAALPEPGTGTDVEPLRFGIYPGSIAGTPTGLAWGVDDDPEEIRAALDELEDSEPLLLRGYMGYSGSPDENVEETVLPFDFIDYAERGRRLHLAMVFTSVTGDVDGWIAYIGDAIRYYGPHLEAISIALEANISPYPRVREALVEGVVAAKQIAVNEGYPDLKVGFDVVSHQSIGAPDPEPDFFAELADLGGAEFSASVDYVGLDIYPDAFRPLPPDGEPGDIRSTTLEALHYARDCLLPQADLGPSVPIWVSEHGWPTGPDRTDERQAEVLDIVIRAVSEYREVFNITDYLLFDLRDAESTNPDPYWQLGIMRDDYTPKAAFATFKSLIAELGGVPPTPTPTPTSPPPVTPQPTPPVDPTPDSTPEATEPPAEKPQTTGPPDGEGDGEPLPDTGGGGQLLAMSAAFALAGALVLFVRQRIRGLASRA